MENRIQQLREALGAPDKVIEAIGDWAAAEAQLGSSLPSDYKEFIETYGTGVIGSWLRVFSPFAKAPEMNLLVMNERIRKQYAEREDLGIPIPFVTRPAPGGLLLWGQSVSGIDMHWLTSRVPNRWSVAICSVRDQENYAFSETMSGFIEAIIKDALWPRAIQPDVFTKPVAFAPEL